MSNNLLYIRPCEFMTTNFVPYVKPYVMSRHRGQLLFVILHIFACYKNNTPIVTEREINL